MRPIKFTPDNLLRVQQMAADGSSSIEIARAIGSTPASVRVKCSQHKIKIGRRTFSDGSPLMIVAHLPEPLSTEFRRKAEDLQIPASVLASRLLAAIAGSNIYEAVLDEE